jgi:hypothetical protein
VVADRDRQLWQGSKRFDPVGIHARLFNRLTHRRFDRPGIGCLDTTAREGDLPGMTAERRRPAQQKNVEVAGNGPVSDRRNRV